MKTGKTCLLLINANLLPVHLIFLIAVIFFMSKEVKARGIVQADDAAPVEITATSAETGPVGYADLGSAFAAINAGTHQGIITVRILGNTVESTTAILNASTLPSDYSQVVIFPAAAGVSVTGDINMPLISLNGAQNVTLDGRLDASGNEAELGLINSNTGSIASTIDFVNGTTNCKVQYCLISGSSTASLGGVIRFGTSSTTGNSGNTVNHNHITSASAGRPLNLICSQGSPGITNANITVNNNLLFDFLNPGNSSNGIYVGSNSANWNITGNSFYETTGFVSTTPAEYSAIRISNSSGNGMTVSGNFIGGSSPEAVGTWIKTGDNNIFTGIYMNVGILANSNSVQGNVIRNFNWTNSLNANWRGIFIAGGTVNTGTLSGNTIGSGTGTGSITITFGAPTTFSPPNGFFGIENESSSTGNIANNTIGSVKTNCIDQSFSGNFYGIAKVQTDGILNLSDNIIGSETEPESIWLGSASSSNIQAAYGIIYFTGGFTGIATIENNTIANISNHTTSNLSPGGRVQGIFTQVSRNVISNNKIFELFSSGGSISGDRNAAVIGIAVNCTNPNINQDVSRNTIHHLRNTSVDPSRVMGIFYTGPATGNHRVSGNFIHSLFISTGANTTFPYIGEIYGIRINNGSTTYANNIVSLGSGVVARCFIYGIYDPGNAGSNNNFYFNTVFVGGASLAGGNYNTYGFFGNRNDNQRELKNNIFYNERSGQGIHCAIRFWKPFANTTLDFNNYFTATTYLARLNQDNITDFATWKALVGQDAGSVSENPAFINGGGTIPADYIPGNPRSGAAIAGIATDFGGNNRPCINTIGAWEVICHVSISSQPLNTVVCENEDAVFTVTASSGCNLSYLWQMSADGGNTWTDLSGNASFTGTDSDTLVITGSTFSLNNNRFRCNVVSFPTESPDCVTMTLSQVAILTVNPILAPRVTISADANPVCAGHPVTFTANPVNGGESPVYQWYVDGNPVGTNTDTFTFVPQNGASVFAVLNSDASPCLTSNPATSDVVTMIVNPLLVPSVTLLADINPVCAGSPVTFSAIPVNGGESPVYQWFINSMPAGNGGASYNYIPENGDVITLVMTPDASTCMAGAPSVSDQVIISVNPLVEAAGAVTGNPLFEPGSSSFAYFVDPIGNASGYIWTYSGSGVTISGSGPIVTLDFSVTATAGRLSVKGSNDCGDGVVSFIDLSPDVPMMVITSVFPEGLYNGGGMLRQASDGQGARFGAGIADQVTLELHDGSNYSNILYTFPGLDLLVSGIVTLPVPAGLSGTCYVTLRHRNHIAVTTAVPLSFTGNSISYDFDQPSKVFGNNLIQMADGEYAIFGGDVNQDGIVDTGDATPVDNNAEAFATGYLDTDVNGDGITDTADMTFIDNNAAGFVESLTP